MGAGLWTSPGEEAGAAGSDGRLDAGWSILTGCSEGGLRQRAHQQSRVGTAGCLPGENSVSEGLGSQRSRGWS